MWKLTSFPIATHWNPCCTLSFWLAIADCGLDYILTLRFVGAPFLISDSLLRRAGHVAIGISSMQFVALPTMLRSMSERADVPGGQAFACHSPANAITHELLDLSTFE